MTCVTSLGIFAESDDLAPARGTESAGKKVHVRYIVKALPTLGGTASNGYGGPNNRGWVTGDANLPGDQTEHAFLWRDGGMTDLDTLGGLNSSVSFPVKDGLDHRCRSNRDLRSVGEFCDRPARIQPMALLVRSFDSGEAPAVVGTCFEAQ